MIALTETCSCGADFHVQGDDGEWAVSQLRQWRAAHHHDPAGKVLPGWPPQGSGSTVEHAGQAWSVGDIEPRHAGFAHPLPPPPPRG